MNAKIHSLLRAIWFVLFCTFVAITVEANEQNGQVAQCESVRQELLTEHDGREAMRLAIENNSRFVAPPLVARVATATVRIISARHYNANDNISLEQRAGVIFSNHNLKAVDDARLYRLSPSQFRVRYIYSLRRLII